MRLRKNSEVHGHAKKDSFAARLGIGNLTAQIFLVGSGVSPIMQA